MDNHLSTLWISVSLVFTLLTYTVQAQQRPKIQEHPTDAIAARDEPLTLNCKATGRPAPDISWYHNGTPLVPSERRVILQDGSLFFLSVMQNKREQDAGIYWCEAKSIAGTAVSRNATLQIAVLRPDFRVVPQDTVALVGGPVVLECTPPRGNPEPSVIWYKDGKLLDLTGKRLSLINYGSLMISEIQTSDSGSYECSAQSMAGIKSAPAVTLKILAPPVIVKGPQDTEVIEGSRLELPCNVIGDPDPKVSWLKENSKLPEIRSRILLDNTLLIEDVRTEDSGKYTCFGQNDGGNLTVSVTVSVLAIPMFIETSPDLEVNEGTTVILSCRAHGRPTPRMIWDRISAHQSAESVDENVSLYLENSRENNLLLKEKIMSYHEKRSAEVINENFNINEHHIKRDIHLNEDSDGYLSSLDNEDDVVLSTQSSGEISRLEVEENDTLTISKIRKTDEGWFACAAINEAGSIVKRMYVRVMDNNDYKESKRLYPKEPRYTWNGDQHIIITSLTASSARSLDVSWDISPGLSVTSLTLHYRIVGEKQFMVATTMIESKRFRLNDLNPYTEYEIFATVPQGLNGIISNMRIAKTQDGPPSAPPSDVRVGVINNTAAFVRWQPPPIHLMNGELIGYKIQIKSNVTNKLLGQMMLNATTQSVVINSLNAGGRYNARIASLTSGGIGPYSDPVSVYMHPSFIFQHTSSDVSKISWNIGWLTTILLFVLTVGLLSGGIFTVFWIRKRRRKMKASYPSATLPTNLIDKEQTWLHGSTLLKNPPLATYQTQQSLPMPISHNENEQQLSEYAEVTNSAPPEPYATVTLQRAIGGNHSDDSCLKNSTSSPSSSEYNAPVHEQSVNYCDTMLPKMHQEHTYEAYKPPNNMTIRTNPTAMSSPIIRRVPNIPPRWDSHAPPIPDFPHNWYNERIQSNAMQNINAVNNDYNKSNIDAFSENDYEYGSVLYEQCNGNTFFNVGGEPTEEYYRNINMEFLEQQKYEMSPPSMMQYNNTSGHSKKNYRNKSIDHDTVRSGVSKTSYRTNKPIRLTAASTISALSLNSNESTIAEKHWKQNHMNHSRARSKSRDRQ